MAVKIMSYAEAAATAPGRSAPASQHAAEDVAQAASASAPGRRATAAVRQHA